MLGSTGGKTGLITALGVVGLLGAGRGIAQEAPSPPVPPPPAPASDDEPSTAERPRRMEAVNLQLMRRIDDLARKNDELAGKVERLSQGPGPAT